MPIQVSTPVSQPEANFSQWWINSIQIVSPTPTAKASARVTMSRYDPTTGIMQTGATTTFTIGDLLGAALTDPASGFIVGTAVNTLLTAIRSVAGQRGLL